MKYEIWKKYSRAIRYYQVETKLITNKIEHKIHEKYWTDSNGEGRLVIIKIEKPVLIGRLSLEVILNYKGTIWHA